MFGGVLVRRLDSLGILGLHIVPLGKIPLTSTV